MKCLVAFLVIVNLIGCTTLQPIDGTAADIQQRILSGQLLKAGDRVKVLTTSAGAHEFTVTGVRDGTISGSGVAILVTQVAGVQKRAVSVGKTALPVEGLVLAGAAAAGVAAAGPGLPSGASIGLGL